MEEVSKPMLTGAQIRAGRALVRMKQAELAERSGVHVLTIKRLESQDGPIGAHTGTAQGIQDALEAAGVELIAEAGQGIGVKLRKIGGQP